MATIAALSNLTRLTADEKHAVEALMETLRRDLDARLLLLVLFGSKARGNELPDTDLDVLLITDGEPQDMEKRMSVVTSALNLEHGVFINTLIFSKDRWENFAKRRAAFWQNVQRDGIVLLRSPRFPENLLAPRTAAPAGTPLPPADHVPEIRAYVQSAWRALRAAESEFMRGQDYSVVANRSYYAIFYAANAMLATEGLQTSKHLRVMALFRDKFVRTGVFEPAHMRDYVETMKRRHVSDYDLHQATNAEFVRVSIESAQRFTSRVEKYLREQNILKEDE